jgi:hypothetical protein
MELITVKTAHKNDTRRRKFNSTILPLVTKKKIIEATATVIVNAKVTIKLFCFFAADTL